MGSCRVHSLNLHAKAQEFTGSEADFRLIDVTTVMQVQIVVLADI
jgi:hypothetical protein